MILDSIEKSIKEKVEALGTPLSKWDIKINRGILTGLNEAFIISGAKKDELIAKDPKSAEIIRPILRGRDIKRYGYEFADLHIINSHNGIPAKGIDRIDINNYPAIKRHLDFFGDRIYDRFDQGDTPYNLRSCAYLEDFYKQKIAWSDIAKAPSFVWLPENIFFNNTIYMIIGLENKDLGILNSSLVRWYFPTISSSLGMGNRFFKEFVLRIPLPKYTQSENDIALDQLVRVINEEGYNSDLNNQVDDIVFNIFSLTDKEKGLIV